MTTHARPHLYEIQFQLFIMLPLQIFFSCKRQSSGLQVSCSYLNDNVLHISNFKVFAHEMKVNQLRKKAGLFKSWCSILNKLCIMWWCCSVFKLYSNRPEINFSLRLLKTDCKFANLGWNSFSLHWRRNSILFSKITNGMHMFCATEILRAKLRDYCTSDQERD